MPQSQSQRKWLGTQKCIKLSQPDTLVNPVTKQRVFWCSFATDASYVVFIEAHSHKPSPRFRL